MVVTKDTSCKMVSKNPSMRQPHCQVYNYVHCLQKYRPLTVVRIDVFSLEWTTQYKMSGLAVMVPESMVGNSWPNVRNVFLNKAIWLRMGWIFVADKMALTKTHMPAKPRTKPFFYLVSLWIQFNLLITFTAVHGG